jgi:hypothetical protein
LTSSTAQVLSIATGEPARCWIVWAGDTLYASSAGSGKLSVVRDAPGEPLALLDTIATAPRHRTNP